MKQYRITGMSCAACQARVEKAVNALPGVDECAVSLLTNSMGVTGEATDAEIIAAVTDAGYGASVMGASNDATANRSAGEALEDHETPVLKKRLISSLVFLVLLMYVSMGHHMWGWPVPSLFDHNPAGIGVLQMLLAGIIMVINGRFFVSGFRSVLHGAPNMDTLVALGAGVSFLYSVAALLLMTRAQADMDATRAHELMNELYFESAGMILTLITVGKLLEAVSKGRTTDALKGLLALSPKTATVLRNGSEAVVPVEEVVPGDIFVVRPGEQIPVDGTVTEGMSAVNEAALSGESIPVDKSPGDRVSAGTLNASGFMRCRAERVGEDTTLSQIIRMVSDAAATKAPIARLADRVSAVFVPVVIVIAVITFIVWTVAGQTTGFALARAIAVLVISCPCALGLATPVAIMVGNGLGARNGILFKTSASLEQAGRVSVIALDKTGTITSGTPSVTDVLPAEGADRDELLKAALALEAKSEHPLGKAVVTFAEASGLSPYEVTDFSVKPGNGLSGVADGKALAGGNAAFITEVCGTASLPEGVARDAEKLAGEGKTPLFFASDKRLLGMIAVADVIREDSAAAIRAMRDLGLKVVMLTGDNERTAAAIGREACVDDVVAGVLPDGKEQVIRDLSEEGPVAMVGDGINDAPALTRADVGIAIGAGTDVAIDAADVVLMKSSLTDAAAAIRLSRATLRNIKQNLFWAFFYNVIGIPLAAGVYYPAFGLTLNPMFGAAAMSLSSFFVVTNALRLNLFRLYEGFPRPENENAKNTLTDKETSTETKEETEMETKTMTIEGMMCAHCEATVKKALEAVQGVESADVSHEKGTAVVHFNGTIDDAVLKQAVEDKEYEVKAIA